MKEGKIFSKAQMETNSLRSRPLFAKRKSQMEIMGLVIIIALLMVGMLFVVKFKMGGSSGSLKQSFKDKETIANFLNAMRLTTVEQCNGASIEQLLIDCYDDKQLQIRCVGSDVSYLVPCDDVADESVRGFIQTKLLKSTLTEWGISYTLTFMKRAIPQSTSDIMFEVYHTDEDKEKCIDANLGTTYNRIENDLKPIPLGSGVNMFVDIKLCS